MTLEQLGLGLDPPNGSSRERGATNEESKVLRVCVDETSQVDKKISIDATQKQKLLTILPMLNAESIHTANKSSEKDL